MVFIDEFGTDDNIVQLRGWSEKGKRSFAEQSGFSKNRTSTVGGYRKSSKEIISLFEYNGTANTALFVGWFEQHLCPALRKGDCVIMDKASIHKSEELHEIAEAYSVSILFLPPYSPDLNPIEKVALNCLHSLRLQSKD